MADDTELVARVLASDDRRAFAELVRRHQSMVRGLLRRLCAGDAARADDLAQETFLRAYRGLHSWRGDTRLSTWLCAIAFNGWRSLARRAPEPLPPEPVPQRPGAEACADRLDLLRALATLREEERSALALAYGQELTHEEAAEILRCPVGTLKTHILRGKEKLRRLLLAPEPEGAR
ncbi:MAG TPA: sigma-70 family RNA polymerase sigma factor [Anaeromyxobacter sp.]|nr:sigma-70 family RNA polymerase sigma factor [Anaeromyxobacter sp.]